MKEKAATPFAQTYFHGTRADLQIGDLVGYNSNFGQKKNSKYIFLTSTLDAAIWGAEFSEGNGRQRVYLVEQTGEIEDQDLTDKKFPGNPTKSYAQQTKRQSQAPEQIQTMKDHLDRLKEEGINFLNV